MRSFLCFAAIGPFVLLSTPASQAAAEPSAEIKRLIDTFEGRWSVREAHEPSAWQSQRATGVLRLHRREPDISASARARSSRIQLVKRIQPIGRDFDDGFGLRFLGCDRSQLFRESLSLVYFAL